MSAPIPYDASYLPPAPVLLVAVSALGGDRVMVPMMIDTGADVTLLPADVIGALRLPRVDSITVSGFGGARVEAAVHAATLAIAGRDRIARVVASGEALLGRDALAALTVELDGPRARLTVHHLPRRRPRRVSPRGGRA